MFFRRLNWNIVGWFKIVSTISYVLIGLGLASMIYHGFQGGGGFQASRLLRLGLSFTGGTDIQVAYTQPTSLGAVKAVVAPLKLVDQRITTVGTTNKSYIIDTQSPFANNSAPLYNALGKLGHIDRTASRITAIGPTLGSEYLRNALLALVIALSIQFLYIAFRFGWNYIFGLVTVIALVRDAAMMIGIYALANKPVDSAFLAAVLTVIGYSVMDTIVILDRIRENTKIMAGQPYATIVNESIKQTMTRSFNTLATVVITLVALLALGGASLKNFAFALLVGICSGGYHSIFYSAPLVLQFRKRQLAKAAQRRRMAPAEALAIKSAVGGPAHDSIVAQRRERREKMKQVRPVQATPARYKRKRADGSLMVEDRAEHDLQDEAVDPLDAQQSGMHDAALEQGHEEVNLNLEGFDLPEPIVEHEKTDTL